MAQDGRGEFVNGLSLHTSYRLTTLAGEVIEIWCARSITRSGCRSGKRIHIDAPLSVQIEPIHEAKESVA